MKDKIKNYKFFDGRAKENMDWIWKKKISSRAAVFFFSMGSAKIEAYERNEGKNKIKLALNWTSSSYTCCLGRKRIPKQI